MSIPPVPRVSQERLILDRLRVAIPQLAGTQVFTGMGGANRFDVTGWALTLNQQFQFGDLRVETPHTTIVVEVESAGGVGNLVKYWPLLASGMFRKRFVLVHVFSLASAHDYIAHRRLWEFLIEQMRADLAQRGLVWPDRWTAELVGVWQDSDLNRAVQLVVGALAPPEQASGAR